MDNIITPQLVAEEVEQDQEMEEHRESQWATIRVITDPRQWLGRDEM